MGQMESVVTLITGGGSGLGRAIVDRFVTEGAAVGVIDHDKDKLAALNDEYGDAVLTIHGDVRHLEDHQRAVSSIVDRVSLGEVEKFDPRRQHSSRATPEARCSRRPDGAQYRKSTSAALICPCDEW